MVRALVVMCLLAAPVPKALAQAQSTYLPPALRGVSFEQRLNEQVPLDLLFNDESGKPISLRDCVSGKPTILVLAYFRCPMLCTEVLNGLVQSMMDLPFSVGDQFNVVTVSFDARETPPLAAAKKKTYVERYARPGAAQGWRFLTGDEDSIERLTQAVGFHFTYDPLHDQFAHPSGIMVLTPTGKIARYFYDIRYPARDLRLALVEASENKIGSPVDQVLLFCFHYDPIEGRYGPVVMNFVRLGGVLTVVALAAFMAVLWRQERRKTKLARALARSASEGSLAGASG
jgi:protein SCO1